MLDLTILTIKALQLNALRDIRQFPSSRYKILNKRKEVLKDLLQEMQSSRNRGMHLEFQGQLDLQGTNGSSYSYQQSGFIVDQTISQYTPGGTQDNYNSAQNDRKW